MNLYPVDSAIGFPNTYPLDRDITDGYRYPPFEQLGPRLTWDPLSLNHSVNFGQFKLCTDIAKNPGPSVYVDATRTIHASYCRGNVAVFGENAGQQSVSMSLCALIYSKIRRITSVDDMIQIMIVGNQYILVCHCLQDS